MKSTSEEHVCVFSILTGVVDPDQPRQEIAVTLPDGAFKSGGLVDTNVVRGPLTGAVKET